MGTTASKQQSKEDRWNASLSHSISLPTNKCRLEAVDGGSKVPWKSKLLSMPKMVNRESAFGNFFGLSSNLQSVQEEDFGAFEEELPDVAAKGAFKVKNGKCLRRSVSFQPHWEPSPEQKISISCKSVKEGVHVAENLNASLKFDPVSDFVGFPCIDEATDRSVGLRSLLNPVLTPSRSFASPTRNACDPKKMLTPRRSFNSRGPSSPGMTEFIARSSSFRESPVMNGTQRELEWVSMADSLAEPASSPLFDPSILATFEKALEGISDDSHQSTDSSAMDNNSSASESESSSDMDSFQLPKAGIDCFESFEPVSRQDGRILESPSKLRASSFLNRTISFSRVFSLKNDDKNWTGKDYLDRFEKICPPAGEGKVVLYFTTLRAVRKTFEDCCMLRLILKGLRVHVDERDVWMHSKFRKELTEVMGSTLPVPRLFILGRHIGGAEEVEQLHEEGILEKMLEGLTSEWREACEVCADVRFIPCITCNGSCKTFSEDDMIERCPDCNENGLIMCPSCDW